VVHGTLAEDGVETGHALFQPEPESHGRSSPFPARAPEMASEGAYAPLRCALHSLLDPQNLMRGGIVKRALK